MWSNSQPSEVSAGKLETMKRLLSLAFALVLSACSFAPITRTAPDFYIRTGSSGDDVCYTRGTQKVGVKFRSVVYEGDALYEPGLGGGQTVNLTVYGRASDPDPSSNQTIKCVKRSSEDFALGDGVTLQADTSKRVSVGGGELARLVVQDEYWLGGSLGDSSILSFPGTISFTNGRVKANF